MSITTAKKVLESGGYTCVLTDGVSFYTSKQRGVKPLVQFIESQNIPQNLFAADKVAGKATAYLYVLLQIHSLYVKVISQPAITVLQEHGITVQYDTLVPNIINRQGDGICPFEAAVMNINSPQDAYTAVLQKMAEMNITI